MPAIMSREICELGAATRLLRNARDGGRRGSNPITVLAQLQQSSPFKKGDLMKWFGIAALFIMPFGYIGLMRTTEQPIEWFVVGFIWALAVGLVLLATFFRKNLEDTPENRELAMKVLKKGVRGGTNH